MLLILAYALAADPTVDLRWKGGIAQLVVQPPAGEHVNLAAPARWTMGGLDVRGTGALAGVRLPMPPVGTEVVVEVPLCADDDSACRLVWTSGKVDNEQRSGSLRLAVGAPAPKEAAPPGRVSKVYDFGAVWCPPCNRMRAEVVDAPEHAALVAAHDRGFIVDYTDTLASTGNLAEALSVLHTYAAAYPEEFTFHFTASRLLLEAGRNAEAEKSARAALQLAWGDQRLRASGRLAKALDALGRRPEALSVLDAELAAAARPAAEQKVRTHRYLDEVAALASKLRGGK